jgi:hypothetical protein
MTMLFSKLMGAAILAAIVLGVAQDAPELLYLLGIVYLLPSIIAILRRPINWGAIIVTNVFLGWTLVGWVSALAMACSAKVIPVRNT